MTRVFYRCPKCGYRPAQAMPADGQCPVCDIYFQKWEDAQAELELGEVAAQQSSTVEAASAFPAALLTPQARMAPAVFYSRCAALIFIAVWGWRLIGMDYRDGEIGGSFMHNILLPIHEAGHVLFLPFGEFLTILGGSFFQLALPLGLAIAFVLRNRDNFAAAVCLWWFGASFLDLAPYVYDALDPQLIMLGGHTGEEGPHDWIYLLERFGQLQNAPVWGFVVHKLGALTISAGVAWAAFLLWQQRQNLGTETV
ncbi:MAG: hypothetical protein IPP85_05655 [Propionivibrio sp.]|nr:hypothetical protein [Propionivibrio sp.]